MAELYSSKKINAMGKKTSQSGQGNAGGWPSTTGNKSGGGRSNQSPNTNHGNISANPKK